MNTALGHFKSNIGALKYRENAFKFINVYTQYDLYCITNFDTVLN